MTTDRDAETSTSPSTEAPAPLPDKVDELKSRLQEAEATLDAIRDGRVDAVVIEGSDHEQHIYTLESADLPFRQFVESMGEGAVSLDGTGTILYCNRFFSQLVGRPRERLIGMSFASFVSPASVDTFVTALAIDDLRHVALELSNADGRAVPVQVALTVVAGVGEARRISGVVTDLSERERIRELRAAQQAAELDILAKDNFLAAVGHDLRSPLNVVLGWAGILLNRKDSLDDTTRKAIVTIERNARLQSTLLDDLLDVSRFTSGKMSVDRVEIELTELARSAVHSLVIGARQKDIDLTVHTDGPIHVLGDASRLEQVLHNLIGNALKFTPRGGHVTVRVARHGERARISIQDDGRGIEPALLPKVFQPFRQSVSRRSGEGGLGLGLAITKSLVELHDGHVVAESEGTGKGSTFTVEIPALGVELHGSTPSEPEPTARLRGVRVLVVDDEDDARDLTARMLRNEGAEVVPVSDAAAALARIEQEQFDIVVSDLMMPGTSGFDLVGEIVARRSLPVALLALSSLSSDDARSQAKQAGFHAFVAKPSEPDVLCRAVLELCTPAPTAPTATPSTKTTPT